MNIVITFSFLVSTFVLLFHCSSTSFAAWPMALQNLQYHCVCNPKNQDIVLKPESSGDNLQRWSTGCLPLIKVKRGVRYVFFSDEIHYYDHRTSDTTMESCNKTVNASVNSLLIVSQRNPQLSYWFAAETTGVEIPGTYKEMQKYCEEKVDGKMISLENEKDAAAKMNEVTALFIKSDYYKNHTKAYDHRIPVDATLNQHLTCNKTGNSCYQWSSGNLVKNLNLYRPVDMLVSQRCVVMFVKTGTSIVLWNSFCSNLPVVCEVHKVYENPPATVSSGNAGGGNYTTERPNILMMKAKSKGTSIDGTKGTIILLMISIETLLLLFLN